MDCWSPKCSVIVPPSVLETYSLVTDLHPTQNKAGPAGCHFICMTDPMVALTTGIAVQLPIDVWINSNRERGRGFLVSVGFDKVVHNHPCTNERVIVDDRQPGIYIFVPREILSPRPRF